MTFGADSEFGFELRVCAWAESEWPPDTHEERQVLVARQLGTGSRRWDTLVLEVDPDALEDRRVFGSERLNGNHLHVVRHAPMDWEYYRDALPEPDYPWRYVREAIHDAADRDAVESRKVGGRIQIRRIAAYPDWVRRIIAIENKPDLTASAARALQSQLERDVALGLADQVWLATESAGGSVEPALLERIPVEVGILALGADGAEVLWHPRSLDTGSPGTKILDRGEEGEFTRSAARFEYLSPAEKDAKRLAIAERAYERGWRSYADTMRPDCRKFDLERRAYGYVPICRKKAREQTASECSGACEHFEPEPPAWRRRGWPIEGGPGKAVKRVLDDRRRRQR